MWKASYQLRKPKGFLLGYPQNRGLGGLKNAIALINVQIPKKMLGGSDFKGAGGPGGAEMFYGGQ